MNFIVSVCSDLRHVGQTYLESQITNKYWIHEYNYGASDNKVFESFCIDWNYSFT